MDNNQDETESFLTKAHSKQYQKMFFDFKIRYNEVVNIFNTWQEKYVK